MSYKIFLRYPHIWLLFLLGAIPFTLYSYKNKAERVIYNVIDNVEREPRGTLIKQLKRVPERGVKSELAYFLCQYDYVLDDDRLKGVFNELGIQEEPAQAYAFLLCWYRKLHGKALGLEKIKEDVYNKVDGVSTCRAKKSINAANNYRYLKIGQKIDLRFAVNTNVANHKSTVYHGCPTLEWDFDTSKDLLLKVEVVDKYAKPFYEGASTELYIKVRIIDKNRADVVYFLTTELIKGDIIEVNLNEYGIAI